MHDETDARLVQRVETTLKHSQFFRPLCVYQALVQRCLCFRSSWTDVVNRRQQRCESKARMCRQVVFPNGNVPIARFGHFRTGMRAVLAASTGSWTATVTSGGIERAGQRGPRQQQRQTP